MTGSSFVERLQTLLNAHNVPDIARKLGMPRNTFYNYKSESRYPSTDLLVQIQAKTGVSIDWLLSGEGPVFRTEGHPPPQPPTELVGVSSKGPHAEEAPPVQIATTRSVGSNFDTLSISISLTLPAAPSYGEKKWDIYPTSQRPSEEVS